MSGLNSAMLTALTGLDAFSSGINMVGNNIANQATSGYAVESLNPQSSDYGASPGGSGVIDPALISRVSDQFAAARLNSATSAQSAAASLSAALSTIDQALSGNGNIQTAASTFFGDLSTLSSEPTNSAQASTVLADGQGVISAFQSAAGSLEGQLTQISGTVQQQVASVNQITAQLGALNKALEANPNGNALLDQQQAALAKLSNYMNVSTVPLGNGAIEVTTNGAVLVDQSGAQAVVASQQTGQSQPVITVGAAGVPVRLGSGNGSLGGALAGFASTTNAINSLNWYAGVFSGLVNQTQAEGLNGSGQPGAPLFSLPPPSVDPAPTNTGSATLQATVTNAAALPSNGQGYLLTFQGGSKGWIATVPNTQQTTGLKNGPTLTLAGMSVAVTGAPKPGDTFLINPEPGAAQSISLTTTSPASIAVADPYAVTPGTISSAGVVTNNNAGSASELSDSVVTSPSSSAAIIPASQFGSTFTLKFTSSASYQIANAAGTVVTTGIWSNGGSVAIGYPKNASAGGKYWQVDLTGKPAPGDVLTIAPGGSNSGSNATRLAGLWTANNTSLPGNSLQGAILSIIGGTGAQSAVAQTLVKNTAQNASTASNNLAAVAGVNQDQQATLLTQYQQAYEAAAKVITTSAAMFQSLIQAV
ncbi:FlgK family flagellar hook-associated protein [Acidiphilium acidophilum]|uniref:FlgK family flagellar hook-associated protein n=1 Tax=Acidiphilium acidophilum TaxID=76588 RepID=UPI002E8E66FC|nr:flagellar basal body rod C-terminal domain-containing protein [Acidiphilium acidophilum]